MKVLINPHRKMNPESFPIEKIEDRIRDSVSLHRTLPGYAPTPLIDLSTLSGELGLKKLWIKDEGVRFGIKAFKALGASYAVYRYLKEKNGGALAPDEFLTKGPGIASDTVFTTATDGNHGKAVAWIARLLGCPALIYMPAGSARARIEAIEAEGAEVNVVEGSYDDAVRRASEDARRHGRIVIADTAYEGYINIPMFVQQGYLTMFAEIREQLKDSGSSALDFVFVQSGVGAFATAAAEFFSAFYPETRLVSVEPVSADCLLKSAESADGKPVSVSGQGNTIMAGLNCGTPSLTAWDAVRDHFFAFIAVEDSWAEMAMRTLARDGVVSGESGCAGLAALLGLKTEYPDFFGGEGNNPVRNVILINTEADTDPEIYKKIVS